MTSAPKPDPPQLSISVEPPAGAGSADDDEPHGERLQEGNDIYLTCKLDANPRPSKPLLWKFNSRPLSAGANLIMNNESLVLRNVNKSQSGHYTCEAANSLGANSSRPLEIVVKYAPTCATDEVYVPVRLLPFPFLSPLFASLTLQTKLLHAN